MRTLLTMFKGGGYTIAADPAHLTFASVVVENVKAAGKDLAVLFLAYTLAPHACYPRQLQQGVEMLRYTLDELDRNPSNIMIGGDSAGLCFEPHTHQLLSANNFISDYGHTDHLPRRKPHSGCHLPPPAPPSQVPTTSTFRPPERRHSPCTLDIFPHGLAFSQDECAERRHSAQYRRCMVGQLPWHIEQRRIQRAWRADRRAMVGWFAGRSSRDLCRGRPRRDLGGLDTRNGEEIEGKPHPDLNLR